MYYLAPAGLKHKAQKANDNRQSAFRLSMMLTARRTIQEDVFKFLEGYKHIADAEEPMRSEEPGCSQQE